VDGILLIDKPAGPTSHDVVACIRRSSGERRIGHTGTLDPRATGLLPLVLGRATSLASLLSGRDKSYDATVRLGWATDTDDADGDVVGDRVEPADDPAAVAAVLNEFHGTFNQTPPQHSAKKLAGRRAYELARQDQPVELAPVTVSVSELELIGVEGGRVQLRVSATSGFYVRALARDLGARLGSGGHLESLRRTRSGWFDVASAIPLAEAEALGAEVAGRLISPSDALAGLQAVHLNEAGLKRAVHGNPVGPEHLDGRWVPPPTAAAPVRLLAADGWLVALAQSRGGALHPVVVLGYH